MRIVYEFVIVGGGFDGAPALAWLDDGKHPPPAKIFVGVCGPGMGCGTTKCRRAAAHISYWTPEEEGRPQGAQGYSKQEEFVESGGDELAGRAVYAIGGLLDLRGYRARVQEPVPA